VVANSALLGDISASYIRRVSDDRINLADTLDKARLRRASPRVYGFSAKPEGIWANVEEIAHLNIDIVSE
jgi:hypothetical protein